MGHFRGVWWNFDTGCDAIWTPHKSGEPATQSPCPISKWHHLPNLFFKVLWFLAASGGFFFFISKTSKIMLAIDSTVCLKTRFDENVFFFYVLYSYKKARSLVVIQRSDEVLWWTDLWITCSWRKEIIKMPNTSCA